MASRFVQEQNLLRFIDLFEGEADPARRALLGRLLIEEEDRYGELAQRLDTADIHLANCRTRIAQQEARMARFAGNDGAMEQAQLLLGNLVEIAGLLQRYRDGLADDLG